MNPADYDAWYDTPRGRWIGETEYALAAQGLAPQPTISSQRDSTRIRTGWITRVPTAARH